MYQGKDRALFYPRAWVYVRSRDRHRLAEQKLNALQAAQQQGSRSLAPVRTGVDGTASGGRGYLPCYGRCAHAWWTSWLYRACPGWLFIGNGWVGCCGCSISAA